MKTIADISRFLVGGLFIFSGLIKVNDPVGTSIKLEEYFEVFSSDIAGFFHVFVPFALPIAVFLCVLEVVIGLAVILNFKMRMTSWTLLVLIIFFSFLTFYSAYFNKVTDCGCFGDAIKLTPWESFTKDMILLALIIPIFILKDDFKAFLNNKILNSIIVGFTVINIFMAVYAISYLPVIDFRAYKIGNHIPTEMKPSEEFIYEYVMEKDGQEVRLDHYPTDKSYTYKALEIMNPEAQPKITDFAIWNDVGDYTDQMMTGKKLFVIIYDVSKTNRNGYAKIVELKNALGLKVEVIALTASDAQTFSNFQKSIGLQTPFYYTDATVLKTIARSNPGLWLVNEGMVKGKWHYNDVPNSGEVLKLLR